MSEFPNLNTLMIQGTTSDAGKTTLVAGLCRLFARKGIRVAPFKPQNMALNSAVTKDGGEIGRSQALQAAACGIAPHTDMNPILLKPNSDTGAQVIVQGQALRNMEATAYQDFKSRALEYAMASHQRLSNQYELILVEGAGSPAEINLRKNDVANMGFAEAADCPVVLVADIDRGGVFAHLVGTLALLSQSGQDRVVGFVINRFRGDVSLLQSGLDWLEQATGKPVLAVLPYLQNMQLDQEDAIDTNQSAEDSNAVLKVKIPVFPRISNHSDFDALRAHPEVDLTYVGAGDDLQAADLVILPGSKSVAADLRWLLDQGLDTQIQKHLRYGGKLLGICGGFQMLGEYIADPHAFEGNIKEIKALNYLSMRTELTAQKTLANVTGRLSFSNNCGLAGYEIHCGVSEGKALENPFAQIAADTDRSGRVDGAISDDNAIAGTYIHGLFDKQEALAAILSWAGLETKADVDRNQLREDSLNRLADSIENHTDWDKFKQSTGIDLTRAGVRGK